MSMTDPISDMLARIRNGISSRKARVEMPASKMKLWICDILRSEGFIQDYRRIEGSPHATLQIDLKYRDSRSAIEGIRRVSKPGRRIYVGKEEIPKVRGGQGIAVLTTSRGVLSDRSARKQALGGEVICEVW